MERGRAREDGIAFFDHMLEQIIRHGEMDLVVSVEGIYRWMNITRSKTRLSCWDNVSRRR